MLLILWVGESFDWVDVFDLHWDIYSLGVVEYVEFGGCWEGCHDAAGVKSNGELGWGYDGGFVAVFGVDFGSQEIVLSYLFD